MEDYWRKTRGTRTTIIDQHRHSESSYDRRHVAERAPDLDDFSDVFGGPPRTVFSKNNLFREFGSGSGFGFGIPSPERTLYRDVFHPNEIESIQDDDEAGRSLKSFRIPLAMDDAFYDEVFGAKTTNETPRETDEVSLAKLRPINVNSKWKKASEPLEEPSKASQHNKTSRHVCSPETMTQEPTSHPSFKASADFMDLNSPVSGSSSLGQVPIHYGAVREDDCEEASSYVIELDSRRREATDPAVSIEEAIAWAKEKFLSDNYSLQPPKDNNSSDIEENFAEEEDDNLQMLSLLDDDVRTWSAGKESNIRLLLSTLHLLLWPSSGWCAVPLACLKESSQVKKAYQRARLCLHPDKLQQRGVTFPQKYVAEKAFPILQVI